MISAWKCSSEAASAFAVALEQEGFLPNGKGYDMGDGEIGILNGNHAPGRRNAGRAETDGGVSPGCARSGFPPRLTEPAFGRISTKGTP
jgi:hypothetical protein